MSQLVLFYSAFTNKTFNIWHVWGPDLSPLAVVIFWKIWFRNSSVYYSNILNQSTCTSTPLVAGFELFSEHKSCYYAGLSFFFV